MSYCAGARYQRCRKIHVCKMCSMQDATKVKFTCADPMSHSRVEAADDMAVDESGVAPPSNEWMEAARMAADTDGILENASAKRQKVCISCHTLTSPAHANHAQECTQRRESLQETRVRVARSCKKERKEEEHPKGQLRLTSALPPKSLPNHCRDRSSGCVKQVPCHLLGPVAHASRPGARASSSRGVTAASNREVEIRYKL